MKQTVQGVSLSGKRFSNAVPPTLAPRFLDEVPGLADGGQRMPPILFQSLKSPYFVVQMQVSFPGPGFEAARTTVRHGHPAFIRRMRTSILPKLETFCCS